MMRKQNTKEVIFPEADTLYRNELIKTKDFVLDYFSQRWQDSFEVENLISNTVLPIFKKDIELARSTLESEVESNPEHMIIVQNHQPESLKKSLFFRELSAFINWASLENFWSIETVIPDLKTAKENGINYIPYLTMPVDHVLEKLEEAVKEHLTLEIQLSDDLNTFTFALNAKFLSPEKLQNNFSTLFLDTFSALQNLSSDSLVDAIHNPIYATKNDDTAWTNLFTDALYLLILRKIEPTKPTKPTEISTQRLIKTIIEVKDCFSYICKIRNSSYLSLIEILRKVNQDKLEAEKLVKDIEESRDRGRNNRHRIGRKYKSIIENLTAQHYKANHNACVSEIFHTEQIQKAIKDCISEQKDARVKIFQMTTFERYIRNKLTEQRGKRTKTRPEDQ